MVAGKKVTLRKVEPGDYAEIHRWQNDPDVFRWMDYEHPFSLEDIRRSEERAVTEGYPFMVVADGKSIGRVGLNNLRRRDEMAAFYLFIGENVARGNGYGLDAAMTMLKFGFDQLNLRMVDLWTLADNDRALGLYKKAGFVEEARLPQRSLHDDQYVGHVVMSIDRASFANSRERYGI